MNINLKWIFIFICFLCFLSLSNVCAIENNSTDLIQENLVDKPILTENNTNLNNSINTHLNSSDVVKYYHGSERYGVYLFDDDGNALANKNVSFILNSMTYKRITNDYGYASIGINLNSGNYSISCFFNGDDYYKPCNCSNWIFVNSTIFADDLVKYFRNSSQYYSLFFSVNGTPLVNTTVTFNINGVFYTRTTNSSGWARLNINLNPGKYIITAFNPVSGESYANNITVLPIIVDNHDLVKYYRNASQYCVRILGPTGNPVGAGEKVTFKIIGVFYTRFTNSSGHTKLNINLQPGNYVLTVEYNNLQVSNTITILSTLLSEDLHMNYNDGSCFEVIVLDGMGIPYPNQTVNFNINGVFYNRVSNENGVARLNIHLMEGTYLITSSCNGLNNVNQIFIGSAIISSPNLVNIGGNITKYYGENKHFTVKLTKGNNALVNKIVKFNINNTEYSIMTDNNGFVILNIDLKPDIYTVVAKFEGDSENLNSNIIYGKITVNKLNSILYCNNTKVLNSDENYLTFYLTDNMTNALSNQPILISFNYQNHTLKTNNMGCAKLKINYTEDLYDFRAVFNGNDYYQNCTVYNILNITFNLFKYRVTIPHYINVTGFWQITDKMWWLNSSYVSTGGAFGKIKLPVSRYLDIITCYGQNSYTIGYSGSYNYINYGSYCDLVLDYYGLSKIHIESYRDYTNITYYGYLTNGTNQFSAIYREKIYGGVHIPDYEEILLVKNGVTQASISFTNPTSWYEEGIRAALSWRHFDHNYLTKPYNQFNNYNSLIFSETQTPVNFTSNYQNINNFPIKEKINTLFEFNYYNINKEEWVSFGKCPSLSSNYDLIQTFAITNSIVNNETIKYYLNKNNTVISPVEKAHYETFLTALTTIWMYDGLVNTLSNYYNVTYCRNKFVVSMCGIEHENTSYIHCPDPLMGISISGDEWINIYTVRYLSSLMLGEIESSVLTMAGKHCNSSVYEIFSRILNFENFTVIYNENILEIYLNNNPNYKFHIDLENGTVYDLTYYNGFIYKGAVSPDFTYCYCYEYISNNLGGLTSEEYPPIYNEDNNLTITDDEWNIIEDFMSEFALAGSSAAIATVIDLALAGAIIFPIILVPIGIAIGLAVVGIALKYDANGGNFGKAVYDGLTSLVLNL